MIGAYGRSSDSSHPSSFAENHDEQLANCINVNHPYAISSLDTHGTCARVYTEQNCNGTSYMVAPGSEAILGEHMNDAIRSISPCLLSDELYLHETRPSKRTARGAPERHRWTSDEAFIHLLINFSEMSRRGLKCDGQSTSLDMAAEPSPSQ